MTRALPPLTAPNDFVNATDRRGLLGASLGREDLQAVDAALRACAVGDGLAADGRASSDLTRLVDACEGWLDATETGLFVGTARRGAVEALGAQAFARLQAVDFAANKARYQAGERPAATQDVGDRFTVERRQFLASGKQARPFPGAMFVRYEYQRVRPDLALDGRGDLAAKDFYDLSGPELVDLDAWTRARRLGGGLGTRVRYMRKGERTRYLVEVRDGRLFTGFRAPVVSGNARGGAHNGETIYAIDVYGNLFCCTDHTSALGVLQHSSYSTGKTVICAGILDTSKDGVLLAIDNSSGHYKPTRQHLHAACALLRAKGIPFARVQVSVNEPGPRGGLFAHVYRCGDDFVDDVNARGEVHQIG